MDLLSLAGLALPLPNILALVKIMGVKKTVAFCGPIIVFATITGWIFGWVA